jgi:hypothetical protein
MRSSRLPLEDRSRFPHRVAALLRDCETGDGAVSLAARQAQGEIFRTPALLSGVPGSRRRA